MLPSVEPRQQGQRKVLWGLELVPFGGGVLFKKNTTKPQVQKYHQGLRTGLQ